MICQQIIKIQTRGRDTIDISRQVADVIVETGVGTGTCQVFIQHTSASLILCENADPTVRSDLEAFMSRMVVDGDPLFKHTAEGPDDMAAHIRTILTHDSLNFPIIDGAPGLGVWQGIYLWEHRTHPHTRSIVVTVTS